MLGITKTTRTTWTIPAWLAFDKYCHDILTKCPQSSAMSEISTTNPPKKVNSLQTAVEHNIRCAIFLGPQITLTEIYLTSLGEVVTLWQHVTFGYLTYPPQRGQ